MTYKNPFLPEPRKPQPLVSAAASRDRMIAQQRAAGHGLRQNGAASPYTRPTARPVVSAEAARERMIVDTIRRGR